MLYDFPNYLETFSMLPWDQMQAGTDDFIDTIKIPIRDNGQVEGIVAGNFPLNINIKNSVNTDIVYSEIGSSFNTILGEETKNHEVLPKSTFTIPTITNSDSVLFNANMNISAVNRNLLKINDTIKSTLVFDNVIAYDDGSAERAYGINGGGTEVKKFAYEFKIKKQDTLAAIQIHFSNIDENVSNLVFSLYAWDSIGISSDYENIIGAIENKKPVYVDPKNAYATFVFDTPIIVKNKFYIGWSQIDNRNIQMGYDLNSTKGKEHIFIFTANAWSPSSINLKGSPMMRAILDGNYPIPANTTALTNISTKEYISVYPNPVNSILNISVPLSIKNYAVSVFDYTGKQVIFSENKKQIDVSSYNQGVYFIVINDKYSNKRYSSKFIVK